MKSIIVVGSIAVDEVAHLEAPLRTGSHNAGRDGGRRIGGGAANTAMAIARGGDRALVVSAIGDDEAGRELLNVLYAVGVDTSLISTDAAGTTRSVVMLDSTGERTIVNLSRARVDPPPDLDTMPADAFYARSADPRLTDVMRRRTAIGPVLAHVPPYEAGSRPATVLVGSASDLDSAFLADPWAAGREIAGETLEWMVVTEGAAGARAFGNGRELRIPAPQVPVTDSTGAGDVFAGGLLCGLARGWDMQGCLRTAVAWGAASVGYEGTLPPPDFAVRTERLWGQVVSAASSSS